jgi:hypothetical protein
MKAKRHIDRLELLVWPGLAWIAAWNLAAAPRPVSSEKPKKKKRRTRRAAAVIPFPTHRVTQRRLQPIEAEVIVLPKSA